MAGCVLYIQKHASLGGAEVNLVNLLRTHSPDCVRPMLCSGEEGFLTRRVRELGLPVEVVRLPAWRKPAERLLNPLWLKRIVACHRSRGVSMVIANDFWYQPYAFHVARRLRVPEVCIVQDSRATLRRARHHLLDKADGVVFVSEGIRRSLEGLFLTCPQAVIDNAVDPDRFSPEVSGEKVRDELGIGADDVTVGMVGSLSELKSQHLLIEAASRIARQVPSVRFVFVGNGREQYLNRLRETASLAGVDRRIVFAGLREDIPQVLAAIDVYAMLSAHEGQPLALLEAMANGKAIAYLPVPGVDEVVNAEVALPIAERSPSAVADAVGGLCVDPGMRERLGIRARKRAEERYSLGRRVKRLEAFYEQFL